RARGRGSAGARRDQQRPDADRAQARRLGLLPRRHGAARRPRGRGPDGLGRARETAREAVHGPGLAHKIIRIYRQGAKTERMKQYVMAVVLLCALAPSVRAADRTAPPDWARDAIWYQIFPERFRNGDPRNDPGPRDMEGSWPHDPL